LETNFQQTIVNLVAQELGIALVHRSIGATKAEGVVFRPLDNAPHVEVVLTWNSNNHNPCITTFVQTAKSIFQMPSQDSGVGALGK
jgi:DNA-binding transcriptional LysR family regulator